MWRRADRVGTRWILGATFLIATGAGLEGPAEAEEFQISPASVMPTPSSQAWSTVDVGTLPRARFEAIGFKELDEFSYGLARIEARLILLGALLDVAEGNVKDPVLDPEIYESFGTEATGLYTASKQDIERLQNAGPGVIDKADDYCKKRPWKCHKIAGVAKDAVASLDDIRQQLEGLAVRGKKLVPEQEQGTMGFEGVEAVSR
jgi:hypothetical protein